MPTTVLLRTVHRKTWLISWRGIVRRLVTSERNSSSNSSSNSGLIHQPPRRQLICPRAPNKRLLRWLQSVLNARRYPLASTAPTSTELSTRSEEHTSELQSPLN